MRMCWYDVVGFEVVDVTAVDVMMVWEWCKMDVVVVGWVWVVWWVVGRPVFQPKQVPTLREWWEKYFYTI